MVAIIYGTLVHTPIKGKLEVLTNTLLVTDDKGVITLLKQGTPKEEVPTLLEQAGLSADTKVRYLSNSQFLMPGFIDTHLHAPQYPFTGTCTDLPLTEWLNKYTFPCERKFQDVNWAKKVYKALVRRLLRNGTTTAVYFATIHLEATQILADTTVEYGQRALVGLVSMDRNAPDDYVDSTTTAIDKTESFIQYCQQQPTRLLTPVITPRFIPTCTIDLLKQLGQLARHYNVPIQSHISESNDEVAFVHQLHPDFESDTTLFDTCGLLTDRSIMAHGVHLSDKDVSIMVSRGSGVSVCPLSNAYFANGIYPIKRHHDIKTGLGTDVAGGYSPSMLNSIRQAVVSSSYWQDQGLQVDWKMALYMATLGGAELIGLGNVIGSFGESKQLDALVIDVATDDSPLDLLWENTESVDLLVEKFINLGDDRCIVDIIVAGNYVTLL
ncbi:guanine deaminase [Chlamydoabsidia padenii]|nr:guanine deaminase [Chlamydoabsidia padenii]